jgi:cytochrome c oxidase subunit 3
MEIPYAVNVRLDTGMNNARLGLWLFLASETMLFGGLISSYVFLRMGSAGEQFVHGLSEIPLAGANTLVILVSSAAITLSVWSLREQAFEKHRILLGLAVFLGLLFIGIKWLDYSEKISRGMNVYLLLTGRKLFLKDPNRLLSRVSGAALYWNFVDAVWIVLFILLYIV